MTMGVMERPTAVVPSPSTPCTYSGTYVSVAIIAPPIAGALVGTSLAELTGWVRRRRAGD